MSEKGVIAIRGAREGCLQGVDLDIPLGQLNCFTGPAGGGARTLAVDVLYREGRRRYLQALSAFEREFHAGLHKAEVDEILGLPPAILLPGTPPRRTIAGFLRFTELASVLFEPPRGEYMSRMRWPLYGLRGCRGGAAGRRFIRGDPGASCCPGSIAGRGRADSSSRGNQASRLSPHPGRRGGATEVRRSMRKPWQS